MGTLLLVLLVLPLPGCASTGARTAAAPPGSGSWEAVIQLSRGSDVVVTLDCEGRDHETCELARGRAGDDAVAPSRNELAAIHVEATPDSLLIRPDREASTSLSLPREMVLAVDLNEEEGSTHIGTLIGLGTGLGICALAGLYSDDDFNAAGKLLLTGACAGGGAAVGHLIDRSRGQPERRPVFRRSDPRAAPRRRISVPPAGR